MLPVTRACNERSQRRPSNSGFKGQSVSFLFTDAEVKDEAFLEYINQILMTGEVAGGRGLS